MGRKNTAKLKAGLRIISDQKKRILITIAPYETRVALLEGATLAELFIERAAERGIVGNIYKAKVTSVLPGMQAAFLDIGFGKNAFLYVSDIFYDQEEYERILELDEEHTRPYISEDKKKRRRISAPVTIDDLVRKNQELLIQISKEPIGRKGPRATTHITLPGRYIVLMPTIQHIGVSRRIQSEEERNRLKELIKKIAPPAMGVIVRTAGEGKRETDFERDLQMLMNLWNRIKLHSERMAAPSLIHQDLGIIYRVVRDSFTDDTAELIIDSEEEFHRITDLIEVISPELRNRIKLYEGRELLFDAYGIESQIDSLLHRKVWLKSGGYICIDEAEALVAIDVNTGKFSGGKDLEATVFKTNMEAAKEIANQIRARALGGLIVIDFIDMQKKENQERVFKTFTEYLSKDRERINVLELTELGLVEMTRRRVRQSIGKTLTQPCPYCNGDGVILSETTMAIKVLQELRKLCMFTSKPNITIRVHPTIASNLTTEMNEVVQQLRKTYRKNIVIHPDEKLHFEKYNIELLDSE
ncbi:MAG: Rne/Rng family ribonuclease [bacterium]|nr:Rne/Rng family ribonuclease [bacterium]